MDTDIKKHVYDFSSIDKAYKRLAKKIALEAELTAESPGDPTENLEALYQAFQRHCKEKWEGTFNATDLMLGYIIQNEARLYDDIVDLEPGTLSLLRDFSKEQRLQVMVRVGFRHSSITRGLLEEEIMFATEDGLAERGDQK